MYPKIISQTKPKQVYKSAVHLLSYKNKARQRFNSKKLIRHSDAKCVLITQNYHHYARAKWWRYCECLADIFRIWTKISLFWLCKHNLNAYPSGFCYFRYVVCRERGIMFVGWIDSVERGNSIYKQSLTNTPRM